MIQIRSEGFTAAEGSMLDSGTTRLRLRWAGCRPGRRLGVKALQETLPSNSRAHGTSLPVKDNCITLDPSLKDAWGLPCMRVTYQDHPDDLKCAQFLASHANQIAKAAGALKTWDEPIQPQTLAVHLLGTCRMGNDPRISVVDRYHRTHDVRNLFICDGSSMVTSSRGQPTETISALAFRAGEHIANFARKGEI
jgi:choline dehydrogenase-like flavoprotein